MTNFPLPAIPKNHAKIITSPFPRAGTHPQQTLQHAGKKTLRMAPFRGLLSSLKALLKRSQLHLSLYYPLL